MASETEERNFNYIKIATLAPILDYIDLRDHIKEFLINGIISEF